MAENTDEELSPPAFLQKGQRTADPAVIQAQNKARRSLIALLFVGIIALGFLGVIAVLIIKGETVPGELLGAFTLVAGYLGSVIATKD